MRFVSFGNKLQGKLLIENIRNGMLSIENFNNSIAFKIFAPINVVKMKRMIIVGCMLKKDQTFSTIFEIISNENTFSIERALEKDQIRRRNFCCIIFSALT